MTSAILPAITINTKKITMATIAFTNAVIILSSILSSLLCDEINMLRFLNGYQLDVANPGFTIILELFSRFVNARRLNNNVE